jgi:TRAP-type C4-dicarboxylate transport system permease small subunit
MTTLIDTMENGFNRFLKFLIAMVAASIGLFAVLIPLNLLMINMQVESIWWLHEAIEYALYVGIFAGAPWVLQQGAHVRVDVFASALPTSMAVQLERFLDSIGVALCLLLCFYGVRAALWEFEDGTLPDKNLRIANWYMLAVFAGSFFLMAVEFLFRIRRARSIVKEDADNPTKSAF